MQLTSWILPALIAFSINAEAQNDASLRLQPASTVKHAGTYHVATNTWTRGPAGSGRAWADVLFDNTCQVNLFSPCSSSQRIVEDGRVPSTSSPISTGPPFSSISWTGTKNLYLITQFELGYCTLLPTVDHEISFWNCFSGCQDATLVSPTATFQILGSPGAGSASLGCWTVNVDLLNTGQPFILTADCDGVWNGGGADSFGWSFQPLTPSTAGTSGPMIAGDPAGYLSAGPGSSGCDIGANTVFYAGSSPTTQGSGLDALDQFERDTMVPPPPVYAGCWFYGGYSSSGMPIANFHLRLHGESTGPPDGPGVQYCPGDGIAPHTPCPFNNDNDGTMGGCDWGHPDFPGGAVLDGVGSTSIGANDTYLRASNVPNNFAIFFAANNRVNGGNGSPMNDGLRCAGTSVDRLDPPARAGGHTATHGPIQSTDVFAAPGVTRRYQYWFRSPHGPGGTTANLSNGYEIVWVP